MRTPLPFKLNRGGLLLAVVSSTFAGEACAVAGWVDFTAGSATISDGSGRQRALAKGDNLDKGDTVRTGENGRAQIRFTDGAYVSLQPNTEFAIKDYNFEGKTDGSERGLFALARGAMRTVTGLIGRVNRNRYQVATPTATIGIRGTGGLISVGTDGSTLVNGTSGIWTLTNPSGTIDVPAGVSAKAPAAPSQRPQQTTVKPDAGPAQPPTTQTAYTQSDQRTSDGGTEELCGSGLVSNCTTTSATQTTNPNPPLVNGSGYHVSYAYAASSGSPPSGLNNSGSLATAAFDTMGRMTQFSGTNSATLSGAQADFGTAAGVLAWGRWTGPVSGTDGTAMSINPSALEGYHYVVGIPATMMPTTGTGSFVLLGSTGATSATGSVAPGSFSGTVNVNWAGGANSITLNATVSFGGFSYNIVGGQMAFTAGNAKWTAGSVPFSVTNLTAAQAVGLGCTGGCTAAIDGAFYGVGAAYAGYAYKMTGLGTAGVVGAATFKQ